MSAPWPVADDRWRRDQIAEQVRALAASAWEAGDDPAFRALARARFFVALGVVARVRTFAATQLVALPPQLGHAGLASPAQIGRVRLIPSQARKGPPWIVLPDLAHWCLCPASGMCWHSALSEVLDALEEGGDDA